VIEVAGNEGEIFELLQGMNEPALTQHLETGQPVKRLLGLPNIAGKLAETAMKSNLSSSNFDRLRFTQYKKSGKGTFEKTAGKGPNVISDK
jgi:hypothetical protein